MEEQKPNKRISYQALAKFMRNSNILPLEKCVLVDLLLYAGVNGEAYPSETTLAGDLGCSSRHIRTQLNKLRDKGWIIGWEKRGFSQSNKYSFNAELYFHNDSSMRNSTSSHVGTVVPLQSGSSVPPNVTHERTQLSSYLLQEFIKANKNQVNEIEKRKFEKFCKTYDSTLIKDAIKKAVSRNRPYFNTAYLTKIIQEWQEFGKPPSKPIFKPCGKGKCGSQGMWYDKSRNLYVVCECKQKHDKESEEWKKKWGDGL